MQEFLKLLGSDTYVILDLFLRIIVNTVFTMVIARGFYFPKSRRRDFFFTYLLVGFGIFMLIHLMGGSNNKFKTGFAMSLFAIFCIMRYRTESVPIREMTYLFLIISLAAINALAWVPEFNKSTDVALAEGVALVELIITDLLFILVIWIAEGHMWIKSQSTKYVKYDKIDLIVPDRREELIEDLKKRTGLNITEVSVGSVDFLKDMALLKVYYTEASNEDNNDDALQKMPKIYE